MKTKEERENKLKELKRAELDFQAENIGIDPSQYGKMGDLLIAILDKEEKNGEFKSVSKTKKESKIKELPIYESVKKVTALQIKEVRRNSDGSAEITPKEKGHDPFIVNPHYMRQFNARAGGYYIVYENGSESFQAAEFFEKGYKRED